MQDLQAIKQKLNFNSKIFSILKDKELLFNEPFLKEFSNCDGSKKYKITIMRCVKNSLVECPSSTRLKNVNAEKLDNNLQRSKATIFELAFCNKWDFFFTGTLDKRKANRENLKAFNEQFNDFIKSFNRKFKCKISYLIIPELHSDLKSWHFHRLCFWHSRR